MIVRVVKLCFRESEISRFLNQFEEVKEKIRHFEGCRHLDLLQDVANPSLFFTYSHWDTEAALNLYRQSPLFKKVWQQTKPLFSAKAEAWTTKVLFHLPL